MPQAIESHESSTKPDYESIVAVIVGRPEDPGAQQLFSGLAKGSAYTI